MGPQDILAAVIWGASLLGIGLGGYGLVRYGRGLVRLGRDRRGLASRAALRPARSLPCQLRD